MASKYEDRKRQLTVERARQLLKYDPASPSSLVYRVSRGGRKAGSVAGAIHTNKRTGRKHWRVSIDYRLYQAHHIVWLLVTGRPHSGLLDHRDRDSLNNRFHNLRECTHQQNARNRRAGSNSQTGIVGVHPLGDKFGAEIMVDGKAIKLGRFPDLETAVRARHKAERIHFGAFAPSLVPSLDDLGAI